MQVPFKTGCFVSQHDDVLLGVYAPTVRGKVLAYTSLT